MAEGRLRNMAKFGITTARQELGFTPATGVRADIDVSTTDVGAAVGQALLAGGRVVQRESVRKQETRQRNRTNLDSLSGSQANELRKQRDNDIEIMKIDTPPEKWEEETAKIVTAANTRISQLDFSPDALAKQQILLDSDLETVPENALIASSRKISASTIVTAEADLTESFRVGTEDIAQRKLDFITTMKRNGVSAPEILLKLKAAEEAGDKLRKADVLDRFQRQAAVDPEATIETLNNELEARKTDEGTIEDLPSDSIQAVINMAGNRITQKTVTAQTQLNQAQEVAEKEFYLELSEPGANTAEIMSRVQSSVLETDAIRRLERDEGNFAQKDANKTWPIVDDDATVALLESELTAQSAGSLSAVDVNRDINAAAVDNKLTRETRDRLRGTSNKGGPDAVDDAVAFEVAQIKAATITRLTDQQARLQTRADVGTLTPDEERQAGTGAFLLQVEQHQVFEIERSVADKIRKLGKDTVSGVESTAIAAEVWETFRRKPLAQKIQELMEFTGKRVPKPADFPDDVWGTASLEEKAFIVEAVNQGNNIAVIINQILK